MPLALKIEGVSKQYRLGQIGGGTLQGDLQSWWARIRGKEDPNSKIGSTRYGKNERFWALSDINLEVRRGEAVGIIGHNGAGKSTLLKLLSRVTAPTIGQISINGRIASMLEVGTGFHAEMTGRENIYMNGAILGMTKAEIDSKIDQIIDFSECRQFIDTPVKRYSSGMYVKLAFAVAAHLDSEIMVMDEVLAVGDMKFQQKALGRMGEAAGQEGRTVLYVSHNMSTIRQLCTRCIVLDHGRIVFDGDVEEAISIYSGINGIVPTLNIDLSSQIRMKHLPMFPKAKFISTKIVEKDIPTYTSDENLKFQCLIDVEKDIKGACVRIEFRTKDDIPVCASVNHFIDDLKGGHQYLIDINVDISVLIGGVYKVLLVLYQTNNFGTYDDIDAVFPGLIFEKEQECDILWNQHHWGRTRLPNFIVANCEPIG